MSGSPPPTPSSPTQTLADSAVDALTGFDPPNLGVAGPICPEGNTLIMTHDFVHRTHLAIFAPFYYPPIFSDWWMDDWISHVYGAPAVQAAAGMTTVVDVQTRRKIGCRFPWCGRP